MDEARQERILKNESLFRDINERIEALSDRLGDDRRRRDLLCECGRADCFVYIEVTGDEYEGVREHRSRFFVAHGHVVPDMDIVVEETDRFLVVEKMVGDEATRAHHRR